MNAHAPSLSDPSVPVAALGDALGVAKHTITVLQKSGHIPRPKPGHAPMIGAMRGMLAFIEAEAINDAPYAVTPYEIPADAILIRDAEAALAAVVAFSVAQIGEAVKRERERKLPDRKLIARMKAAQADARALGRKAARAIAKGDTL